jgi:hypothetical protein
MAQYKLHAMLDDSITQTCDGAAQTPRIHQLYQGTSKEIARACSEFRGQSCEWLGVAFSNANCEYDNPVEETRRGMLEMAGERDRGKNTVSRGI